MKRTLLTAVSVLSLLAVPAFAQSVDKPGHQSPKPGTNSETMSAIEDTTAGLVGKVSAEMTSTTKGFVNAAAISDAHGANSASAHSALRPSSRGPGPRWPRETDGDRGRSATVTEGSPR